MDDIHGSSKVVNQRWQMRSLARGPAEKCWMENLPLEGGVKSMLLKFPVWDLFSIYTLEN